MTTLVFAAALGVLSAILVTSCGGDGAAIATATGITRDLPTLSATAPAAPGTTTVTVTDSAPRATQTVTVTESAPAVTQTVTVAETTPPAAETVHPETVISTSEWGWIAFFVLAAAVLLGGIVWWLRRRSAASPAA